jgi:hypothetical protein
MTITFTRLPSVPVTFTAMGLPSGATWYVNLSVNGTPGAHLSAQGPTLATYETAGEYAFSVASSDKTVRAPGGSFQVGSAAVNLSIVFTAVTYAVTFTETGLPSGTNWSVTLNGLVASSIQSTIVFAEVNGTYLFSFAGVAGYTISATGYSPASTTDALTVSGAAREISVTFTEVTTPTTFLGLPGEEGIGLVIAVVAAIAVGVVLGVWLRRRPRTTAVTPPPPPP